MLATRCVVRVAYMQLWGLDRLAIAMYVMEQYGYIASYNQNYS